MLDRENQAQEEPQHYTITFDLAAAHGRLSAALQRLLDAYAAAAVGLPKVDDAALTEFRPFFKFEPASGARLDPRRAAEEADRWLLRTIMRDALEFVHTRLESCRLACAIAQASRGGQTTGADYLRITEPEAKAFHKHDLPTKLRKLREAFGVSSELEPHVTSVNRVRACLVHRFGKVSELDVRGDPDLKLLLRSVNLVALSPDRKTERPLDRAGVEVEAGWTVNVRIVNRTCSFKLNEQVTLTYRDVADTVFTLIAFSQSILKATEAFARAQGIVPKAKGPRSSA